LYRALLEVDRSHPWPVVRAREIERWVKSGEYERILSGEYVCRASAAVAVGKHPNDGEDGEAGAAAAAELAILVVVARAYGAHVASRSPRRRPRAQVPHEGRARRLQGGDHGRHGGPQGDMKRALAFVLFLSACNAAEAGPPIRRSIGADGAFGGLGAARPGAG